MKGQEGQMVWIERGHVVGWSGRGAVLAALLLMGCENTVVVASGGGSSSRPPSGGGAADGGGGGSGGTGANGSVGTGGDGGDGGDGGSPVWGPLTIPAAEVQDIVHDAKRDRLYISTGGEDGGEVLVYNFAAQGFEAPLLTGGSFQGIDLSPDEDAVIVADRDSDGEKSWVYLVDLTIGAFQKIEFDIGSGEAGTFTTVFTSDTEALVTSHYNGSGHVPLRKLDLTSGAAQELITVNQGTMLARSADGSTVAYAESNSSAGPWGRYDVGAGTFTDSPGEDWFVYEIGVSRTASQFAVPTYGGLYVHDGSFVEQAVLGVYADEFPVGAVYSPVADELYLAWYGASVSIDAYSTSTLTKVRDIAPGAGLFTTNGNHAFVSGRIRVSRDGRMVFATSEESVVVYPTGL